MSQSGIANLAQTGGGGLIQTINGDTGSITGNTVTIFANRATNNSGASVFFTNSGTVSTLNLTDGFANTFLGNSCGGLPASLRAANVGIGVSCLAVIATGVQNTAAGYFSMASCTSGNYNSCYGNASGANITTGLNNIAIGYSCNAGSTGSDNISIGGFVAGNLISGNGNIILNGGSGYTSSESYNILINNSGSVGESNALRIGTQANLGLGINKCYIAGIVGVTASNAQLVTINSSTGQLGVSANVVSTWTDVSGSVNAAVGNGYFVTATCTSTLPAAPAQGNIISYIVDTTDVLTITANTGQFIRLASVVSASAGTCVSTARGNSITLVYRASDTTWLALSANGNWSIT